MKFSQSSHQIWFDGDSAFTLLELLGVLAIMTVLFALLAPAVNGLKGAGDFTSAAYSIQGALEQARTYAVANNTYTWVGFFEEDNSQASQTPAKSGIGRIVLCIVASRDGTCIYSKAGAEADTPASQSLLSSRLIPIAKLIKVSNVHIVNAASRTIGKRPAGIIEDQNLVGLASQPRLFSFSYPLAGTAAYTFGIGPGSTFTANGVIQFNPQGEAVSDTGPVTIPATSLEIAIEETHGIQVSSSTNIIALDVSGLTGQTTIYSL